jgi:fumarate reductase subunit D
LLLGQIKAPSQLPGTIVSESCQCQLPVIRGNVSACRRWGVSAFFVVLVLVLVLVLPFGRSAEGETCRWKESVLAFWRSSIVLVLIVVVVVDCFLHEQNDDDHDDEDDHEDAIRF